MQVYGSIIQNIFSSDVGVNLLRSKAAPVIIPFLFENFKLQIRQQIYSFELEEKLTEYIQNHINVETELEEELDKRENELLKNLDNKKRAKKYIDIWCSPQKRYLRRIVTGKGAVLLLDPAVDRMFSWLEKCQENQTIGAESRFSTILNQLRDLNQKTNQNAASRIAELKKQRAEIDKEITQIKSSGIVSNIYDKYQIQERLSVITQSSKDLLGDFNQIRTNFQSVINDIYNKQSEKQVSRGDILGYTLDTNDALRTSPQGRSFTSFWNFISSDTENEINLLVDSIMQKAREQGLEWNDNFLFNLSKYFFESGSQIVAQNRVLTSRINRMLSFRESGEASRINELIQEIKDNIQIYNKGVKEKKDSIEMEVETKANLFFPQARIPVFPQFDVSFGSIDSYDTTKLDQGVFENLISQFYIDTRQLEENLAAYFKTVKSPFSLGEFTKSYPITLGLSEIVAFYSIKDGIKSTIDDCQSEQISYTKNGRTFVVQVPRIVFYE